jgi:predicted cupin superfamily sugar epimerase
MVSILLFEFININAIIEYQAGKKVEFLMVNDNKFTGLKLGWRMEFNTDMRTADPEAIKMKKGEIMRYRVFLVMVVVYTGVQFSGFFLYFFMNHMWVTVATFGMYHFIRVTTVAYQLLVFFKLKFCHRYEYERTKQSTIPFLTM